MMYFFIYCFLSILGKGPCPRQIIPKIDTENQFQKNTTKSSKMMLCDPTSSTPHKHHQIGCIQGLVGRTTLENRTVSAVCVCAYTYLDIIPI